MVMTNRWKRCWPKGRPTQIKKLPAAHRANIDVDEVGFCVVTYATAMQGQGSVAYLGRRNSGDADVDGFGFHMLAVQRHTVSMLAQVVVAPRSAIAADDVDCPLRLAEAGH
jgi:hypothetical protein